jgi:putative molybdopterin biosynthesis protein
MGRCGLLPIVRLGRQIRVEEARLMSWIESGGRALPGGWKRYPS